MEPEPRPESTLGSGNLAELKKVTTFSKYFALVLFIILPFVGGWIGYRYAPEKVVEVEKLVTVPAEVERVTPVNDARTLAFVSYNDRGWRNAWVVTRDSDGNWINHKQLAGKYIVSDGVLLGNEAFFNVSGEMEDSSDWTSRIVRFNVQSNNVSFVDLPGIDHIINILKFDDQILAYYLNDSTCVDSPFAIDNEQCVGNIAVLKLAGDVTHPEIFSNLPAAAELVAYDPKTEMIVLLDGYGDAGCVSSSFHTYDLRRKSVVDEVSFSGCSEPYPGSLSLEEYDTQVNDFIEIIKSTYPSNVYSRTVNNLTITDDTIIPNDEPVEIEGVYSVANILVD